MKKEEKTLCQSKIESRFIELNPPMRCHNISEKPAGWIAGGFKTNDEEYDGNSGAEDLRVREM